ncbi:MAG TPA: hypothetical protein VGM05_18135 [Planctomycetaceae bacterium]
MPPPVPPAATSNRRSRWTRRLLFAIVLLLAVGAFHGWLLTGLASCLVFEDPPAPTAAVLLLDGDRQFDTAARLYREGRRTILVYRSRPDRLVRMGVLPQGDELARRELSKRGVSNEDVVVLAGELNSKSVIAAAVGNWLREHPEQTASVLCDRFTSRVWKLNLQWPADPGVTERVRIVAIPNRRFNETNWWQSKPGLLAFANGFLRYGFHACQMKNKDSAFVERTPAEFRAAFTGDVTP